MIVYLAGENKKKKKIEEIANGSLNIIYKGERIGVEHLSILDTFFYHRNDDLWYINKVKNFLLDSGAFTFMMKGSEQDLDSYVDSYIEYIKRNNVRHYIELDVDIIKGLKWVEKTRAKIERETGMQSIPVWHIQRGKDYYLGLVKDYKRVCFGGLMSDGVATAQLEKYFPWFIEKAHENDCKIHGLGYMKTQNFSKYKFDSVDSTTWLVGSRAGYVEQWDYKTERFKKFKMPNSRLKTHAGLEFNFCEWVKFQQYAYNAY